MRDLVTVASFTIKDMLKRKSFIVSNLIIIAIILVGFNVPRILDKIEEGSFNEENRLLIVDAQNMYEGNLEALKEAELPQKVEILTEDIPVEEIKEKIRSEEYNAALVIRENEETGMSIEYIVDSIGMSTTAPNEVISAMQTIYQNMQLAKLNVPVEQLVDLNKTVDVQISQAEENEAHGNIIAMMLLSIVLFYAIYFFAYQVSTSITTEKTSKIIETLVTSTTPRTIVLGKTIGIGIVGILQTVILIIVAVLCAKAFLEPEMLASILDLSTITPTLAIYMIVYFFLGYSLYALLYALTGSTVSKPEDIQSANGPVAILAVIGFYLSYFTMMNPGSSLNIFASIFPLSAPFCMPFRIMMGVATTQEIALSIGITIITILLIAHISIKVYSNAILNYGTKLSLRNIVKMYKTKN